MATENLIYSLYIFNLFNYREWINLNIRSFTKFMENTSKPQKLVVYKHTNGWFAKDFFNIKEKKYFLKVGNDTEGARREIFAQLIDLGYEPKCEILSNYKYIKKLKSYIFSSYSIFELKITPPA